MTFALGYALCLILVGIIGVLAGMWLRGWADD